MGTLQRKLVWLIVSRVAILTALVAITSLFGNTTQYAGPISALALIILGLSLVYAVALRFGVSPRLLVSIQLVVDVILTTWLVYETGDIVSPFVALYLVIVFATSLLSSRIDIVVISIFAVAAFASLYLLLLGDVIPRADGVSYTAATAADAHVNFGFALVAILAVAMLSTHLAQRQRRADVDLATAARSLADLRAFNERIIESMRSGLITTDLNALITSFNRAAEEITGYGADEVIGRPLSELFRGVEALAPGENQLQRLSHVDRSDVSLTRPDGSTAKLGFTVTPLTDVDGEVHGLVVIFQDLTEVFELEQEVRRQEKLAALGTLAAGLAHEIRNPLASMRGSVQVLAGEVELSEDQKRLMGIILRESDRLNRTVTDFLAYARPAPFTPALFDLKRSLADAVALLRNNPEMHPGHEIVEVYPDDATPFFGDQNQIHQVFWNLARNALQAMPEGGRLTVRVEPIATGYRLSVEDEGAGMTHEQIERLFEPFASKRHGGTGLGMAIVYQFITDHGGRISVDSAPYQGTRVYIVLPNRSPRTTVEQPSAIRDHADSTAR